MGKAMSKCLTNYMQRLLHLIPFNPPILICSHFSFKIHLVSLFPSRHSNLIFPLSHHSAETVGFATGGAHNPGCFQGQTSRSHLIEVGGKDATEKCGGKRANKRKGEERERIL